MLGISFYELLVVVVVAVIILRPKDFMKVLSFAITTMASIKEIFSKVQNKAEQVSILSKFDDYIIEDKIIEDKSEKTKDI
jgi:Sec-independent protein translocase protein TatA